MVDSYIRTDDGALMVRRSSHQYVSAAWALKARLTVGGRYLTREAIDAMQARLTADAEILEAAE